MTLILTDDERDLLRELPDVIEIVVAEHEYGVDALRHSHRSGARRGFHYAVEKARITGEWSHYEVLERLPEGHPLAGEPSRLRFDPPHREVSITLTRLLRWAESLPDELHQRARTAWATETRDLAALRRIVLEAVELGVPVQLGLFGVA